MDLVLASIVLPILIVCGTAYLIMDRWMESKETRARIAAGAEDAGADD